MGLYAFLPPVVPVYQSEFDPGHGGYGSHPGVVGVDCMSPGQVSRFAWGQLVQELRLSRKISQRRLSLMAGVSRNAIRRVEEGEETMQVRTLEAILKVLGHELEALPVGDVFD